MKTLLLVAFIAAIIGLVTSVVVLFNFVFGKKKQIVQREKWH
jgi:hypothetical protein